MSHDYILYSARRSSASYRVRIALQLKAIPFREQFLDLAQGDHTKDNYRKLNPQGLVPALQSPDGAIATQSLAIIDYLEELHPAPRLLPADLAGRARVRSLALHICCEIHPLNNMRVRNHVRALFPGDSGAQSDWMDKWNTAGFDALERQLAIDSPSGDFCHGGQPTLADVCLVPQVFNARFFSFDLEPYPNVRRIAEACEQLEPFQTAHPDALA